MEANQNAGNSVPLLSVRGIYKSFGLNAVLKGIDLDVMPGEVLALIGGSLGSIAGMHLFRHKTRHWYFLYGMPAILIVQILLVLLLVTSPIEILVM